MNGDQVANSSSVGSSHAVIRPGRGTWNVSIKGLPDYLGQIERSGEQVYIICGEAGATLNNERIAGRRQLALGDRLRFGERGQELSLILVRDEST